MEQRKITWKIIEEVQKSAYPKSAVIRNISKEENKIKIGDKEFEIKGDLYVLAVGKASIGLVEGVLEVFGEKIRQGIIVIPKDYRFSHPKFKVFNSGHPIPDEESKRAGKEVLNFVRSTKEEDIIIFLLSGGGSALLTLPRRGITLQDKIEVNKILLNCGARIQEINTVRKHLSTIKGGNLAKNTKGTLITLVVSDVLGDPLDSIASGPTVPDTTTFHDVANIFTKYDLWDKMPENVINLVKRGIEGLEEETPKSLPEKHFIKVILSNRTILLSAENMAKSLGFNTTILTSFLEGEARESAHFLSSIVKEIKKYDNPIKKPACIIVGGETTVTVRGKGKGGRNQELSLSFAIDIQGMEGVVLISYATDGKDGPTDACGAIATGDTVLRAQKLGLDPISYLKENNSYEFFNLLQDLIKIPPTNTNLNDVIVITIV